MSTSPIDNVAVLGLGLMGGSLAAAFSGHTIGYARRRDTLDAALMRDIIDEAVTRPEAAVKDADLVVICTPILAIPEMLAQIRDHLKPGAIVTDVGSTKSVVQKEGERILEGSGAKFVGSHPMCGSDQVGLDSVIPHLYDGARVVVMDVDGSDSVSAFWMNLGSEVLVMNPDLHDELVAASSHLPHMAAVAIVQAVAAGGDLDAVGELCGTGFRDTTRVANGSADVWRDIVQTNAGPVGEQLKLLRDKIDAMITLMDEERFDGLAQDLRDAAELRNRLLGKENG